MRQKPQNRFVCDGGKYGAPDCPNSPKPPPICERRRRVLGRVPVFLEVGTRGRSRARWGPASVPKLPPNSPPMPPLFRREGCEKGPDGGQSSKKERFHPKRGLTWGVCLAGVALNRRIVRGKKEKERQKKKEKKKKGCWQQGIFAQISESTKTAGNCPKKPRQRGTPDTKRQREAGSKTSQKNL